MLSNFGGLEEIMHELFSYKECTYSKFEIHQKIQDHNHHSKSKLSTSFLSPQELDVKPIIIEHQSEPINDQKRSRNNLHKQSVCIIYVHGYSSYCLQGLYLLPFISKYKQLRLCLYDMRGHGKNTNFPITFGLKQSTELLELTKYLNKSKGFDSFVFWGRSMGAVTCLQALLEQNQKYNQIHKMVKLLVLDSPFTSFKSVTEYMINNSTGNKIPSFLVETIASKITDFGRQKYGLELQKLDILKHLKNLKGHRFPKSIFLSSEKDEIISYKNTQQIIQHLPNKRDNYQLIDGDFSHNEPRPTNILKQIFQEIQLIFTKEPKRVIGLMEPENREKKQIKGLELCFSNVQKPITDYKPRGTPFKSENNIPGSQICGGFLPFANVTSEKNNEGLKFPKQKIKTYQKIISEAQLPIHDTPDNTPKFTTKKNNCTIGAQVHPSNKQPHLENTPYINSHKISCKKQLNIKIETGVPNSGRTTSRYSKQEDKQNIRVRYPHHLTPKQILNRRSLNNSPYCNMTRKNI